MNDFYKKIDDYLDADDEPRVCLVCGGDGGWWEDGEGRWSEAPEDDPDYGDYGGDHVWVKCESCGGAG